ncbi:MULTISPECIES: LPD25 domain-containing protein [unclassified Bacillus (in: firmicutes)]|uniref:LPD25 domain-containing protein n=1 Tax=unclassified Bacillus (in: firmicutes) TaxID=185979 RepID=UPI0023D9A990|nr:MULTISPECIES: LPD25 domain-containing protein [unclassified Bacillus (in: firmicutes)]MCU4759809.1 ArdC-like ssDNA-binding domain-containing protein [Bacillus cereus]MDF2018507.1 ArdC-like ssDNA-binding domain-containing protein [Bacillus sp. Cr_R3]MDF2031705.1 ArdC-like ssDNA-binding domain-containing protein [Bacillus sp. Cr_R16]
MSKNYKKKYQTKSPEEKKEAVQALTKKMEKSVEGYFRTPGDLKEYLSFMAKFYQYSPSNISLIQSQFEGASAVGSFSFWKEKGFAVKKGEKGIQILVPNRTVAKFKDKEGTWKTITKASEEEKKQIESKSVEVIPGRLYFAVGHVFDASQTNVKAEDLPRIFPNRWLEGSVKDYKSLYRGMEAVAEKNGVKIIAPKAELGVSKGVSYTLTKEVALNPRNSELQNVKTLLHELAHAKLHTAETHMNYTAPEKEFQAEMTAYAVSSYFGIDTSEYSLGYLANWTQGKEMKDKTKLLKEVHETSIEFIETIESSLEKEKQQINEKEVGSMAKGNEKQDEKNILLVEYMSLSNTTQELVSVAELREQADRNRAFESVEGAEKLSDKEFIDAFNEANQEKYAALNQDEITRPTMLIQWSENENFTGNQLIPFGEANEKMSEVISNIEKAKEEARERDDYVPYDKTRYHIAIPKEVDRDFGRMELVSMDRLDMGDGDYKTPYEQILNEKRYLSDEVKQALRDEVVNYRSNKEMPMEKAHENTLENIKETPNHLVTIEVLDKDMQDEEVARIHMMDGVTKEINHLSIWNPDKSDREDLYVSLMEKNGNRENVYLDNILKTDLYEKVQNSIFDGKGNQSFVVYEKDANMSLDEIVKDERYGLLVDKAEGQKDYSFNEKEVELYKEMKKEGYAPIASLNQQIQPSKEQESTTLDKDLSRKYEAYRRSQYEETPDNIDSIVTRVKAEERYYTTKYVSIDNELVSQEHVVKLENQVDKKLGKEGITVNQSTTSKEMDVDKKIQPLNGKQTNSKEKDKEPEPGHVEQPKATKKSSRKRETMEMER